MGKKYDLFIIDDDPIVIKKMVSLLSTYDIQIQTFLDPVEGLSQLTANPPTVVFLDYNMPTMNAKNFIIKMSERYLFQHTAICLISAMEFDKMAITQLHTLGFSRVIKKPFTEEELVSALSEFMGPLQKKSNAA